MRKWNHRICSVLAVVLLVFMVSQWSIAVRAQQQDYTTQGDYETPEVPIWGPVYGDANGDGEVNVKDVVLLRQYLAGWNVTLEEAAADANGDGRVNVKDVVLLRQYLAGWDVTLGPSE